jgi:hypothetical protein
MFYNLQSQFYEVKQIRRIAYYAASLNNRGSKEISKGYRQLKFVTLFLFLRFTQGFRLKHEKSLDPE